MSATDLSTELDRERVVTIDELLLMEEATGPAAHLLLRQSGLLSRASVGRQNATTLRVLDNACGGGIVTNKIFEAPSDSQSGVVNVTCGDFALAMVEIVEGRIKEHGWNAEARAFNCLSIPFPAGVFDAVFTNSHIQFMEDAERAVRETHRVLKPGGTSSFTMWLSCGWLAPIQAVAPEVDLGDMFTNSWATEGSIRDRLTKIGFEDIKTDVLDFSITFPSVAWFGARAGKSGIFANGVAEKIEAYLEEKHGTGTFVYPGWTVLAVTAVKSPVEL